VIIEGPEGSGKSTAAMFLQNKFGFNYYHDGPPDPDVTEKNFFKYYNMITEAFRQPFVWDRSILGELVYGPIFRSRSRASREDVWNFVGKLGYKGAGITTILLLPSLETVRQNWYKTRNEQKDKAKSNDAEAAKVKTALLNSLVKLEYVWFGYEKIRGDFDYVLTTYPTMKDWIEVLG
jgi:hypothetical protein